MPASFPCPEDKIAHYTAYRADSPPRIDGKLDETCWRNAPRSPRFVDLISGRAPIHDTHAAVLLTASSVCSEWRMGSKS